jgi:hypothetical protein
MPITKISQSDDPALDWRKINELIDAVSALRATFIFPSEAGAVRSDGQKVILDLSGLLLRSEYEADKAKGDNDDGK